MFQKLETIGKRYDESRKVVTDKIKELCEKRENTEDKDEKRVIEYDLVLLRAMERDLRGIGKEACHYYERGWWRSEDITFNSRKSRKHYATYIDPEVWKQQ